MNDLDKLYDEAVALYNSGDELAAIKSLKQLAMLGHTPSMCDMGRLCESTLRDGTASYSLAAFYYKEAAKRGDVDAQYNIGRLYYDGAEGVRRNFDKAFKWLTLAATQGDLEAQVFLADIYQKGSDYSNAIKWYTLAAESISDETVLGAIQKEIKETKEAIQKTERERTKTSTNTNMEAPIL